MACPPPRSRSASRAGKRSNKSRKSSNSLFARLLRPLVGKTAIAAYSAATAAGSFLLAPQLEGARHWARDNALHWLQTQPLVRDASHWLEDQQDQWTGWQEDLLTLARQSRESAHPSSGGNKASQPPPPIGAFVVNGGKSWLTVAAPEYWLYVLGALFIVVTLFMPGGLIRLPRQIREWHDKRRALAQPSAPRQGV